MKCPKCRAFNPDDAIECSQCAVQFKDLKGARPSSSTESKPSYPGHDSNPNDTECQSCRQPNASIYPGVLRGGGKGYCSDCYRRMRSGGYQGPTEHGSQTAKDLRELLHIVANRLKEKGKRRSV